MVQTCGRQMLMDPSRPFSECAALRYSPPLRSRSAPTFTEGADPTARRLTPGALAGVSTPHAAASLIYD